MSQNPYSNLPPSRFWKTGVAESNPLSVTDLYKKKFPIGRNDKIATAGSCFAQHLATHLRKRSYNILDYEPPIEGMSLSTAQKYGYRIYSARYGNIYTVRQLLQIVQDALHLRVRDEDIWEKNGRYFDGLRPAIEPHGLSSAGDVRAHRLNHLRNVRRLFKQADILVFTLGLTEAWLQRETGTVYPVCPGVIAGTFDSAVHEFKNFDYVEILADLTKVHRILKKINPGIRFLLTVSPVPLTATASGNHVLVATTESKSILRSVCGAMERQFADVDYFPSYELIAAPFSRGFFYESNLRSVTTAGVDAVMRVFFSEHGDIAPQSSASSGAAERRIGPKAKGRPAMSEVDDDDEAVCEEKMLETFRQ